MATLKVCVRKSCPDGDPVSGARVQIDADYGGPTATTDSTGCCYFMYLQSGYHTVHVNGKFCCRVLVIYYNEVCCEG
ncbi:MAG: carboxypeptidase regulatory-like domain-containing protein [Armatimonadetes bacterium]|nr:carboxypeptidase regulatory-like domain-containing protein [Armatimonadota bacterium]